MILALADAPRSPRTPAARSILVAVAFGALFLWAGATIRISRDPPAPPLPSACLADAAAGAWTVGYADSLEDCGARLEGLYLRDGEPMTGSFGGMRLFADAAGIDAANLHGPREHLFAPAARKMIDDAYRRLIAAQRTRPAGMMIEMAPPRRP